MADAKRAVKKPNFSEPAGGLVEPDYLPPELQRELLAQAGEALPAPDAQRFVAATTEVAFMVLAGSRGATNRDAREHLLLVADTARELLTALRRLGVDSIADIGAHELHPLSGSPNSPVQWPELVRQTVQARRPARGLLSISWDFVEALEGTTRHAAGTLQATRHGPGAWASQSLVHEVIQLHHRMFGSLPPKDRDGWFVAYMQSIGNHFGLQCGPRPVASAIEEAQNTPST